MLEVRVMCLGKGAIPVEKGRIYYDGKLHPSDDSYLLREILANEIYTEKGKKLRAEDNPEAFFRGLSGHYRSAYLRVTAPKEIGTTKSLPGAPQPPEHPVGTVFSTVAKDGSTWWFRVDSDRTRRIPDPNKPLDEISGPKVGQSPVASETRTSQQTPESWGDNPRLLSGFGDMEALAREEEGAGQPELGTPLEAPPDTAKETLQETPEETPEERPVRERGELKSYLQTAKISKHKSLGGGINVTDIITLEDGTKGVLKPAYGEDEEAVKVVGGPLYIREIAASDVAEVLKFDDLVPATINRQIEDRNGSLQAFVPDADKAMGILEFGKTYPQQEKWDKLYDGTEDHARAASFDYLIGNLDRHDGNWLVDKKGKLVLIDHGTSFPKEHDPQWYAKYANGMIYHAAVHRELPIPEQLKKTKWEDLQRVAESHRFSPPTIALMKKRFEDLQNHKTFGELHDTFKSRHQAAKSRADINKGKYANYGE